MYDATSPRSRAIQRLFWQRRSAGLRAMLTEASLIGQDVTRLQTTQLEACLRCVQLCRRYRPGDYVRFNRLMDDRATSASIDGARRTPA